MSADSFAAAFDAIEIDPARAPSSAAIEAAMAMCAPTDEPGFYLLDDCGGRFAVDREFGFISLTDDATLEAERGEIRSVRLKVVEHSGAAYELALRLRIGGRVPQVVSETAEPGSAAAPAEPAAAPEAALVAWDMFAASLGGRARPIAHEEDAPFACLVDPRCFAAPDVAYDLGLAAPLPRPASAAASWQL